MKIRFNNLTAIASMILLLANISMPLLAEQKYDEGLFWKIEKDGQFVGEMSFLTEKSATATCIVKHDTECLMWKQPEFKDLLKRNPSLYYTIQGLLSNQLVSYSNK